MSNLALKLANLIGETGLYRMLCPGRLPVFVIHRIKEDSDDRKGITASQLRDYLQYLSRRGFLVFTMSELWQYLSEGQKIPSRSVMFTIDDGFFDYQNVAAKIFDEYGFPLNFFVITGMLDQEIWPWDHQVSYAFEHSPVVHREICFPSGTVYRVDLEKKASVTTMREVRGALKTEDQRDIYQWLKKELFPKLEVEFPASVPREYRPMSWNDARSLYSRGHGVYPHTRSHRILSTLSAEQKREEIQGSLKRVEDELGYTPQVFAYPTGRFTDYDEKDIEELRQAGVKMAFNTVPAYVQHDQDRYQFPRFPLPENPADFLQIVTRLEALKEKMRG